MINPKIGFISFIPDGGHVLPLLRMAEAFKEHQYEVICYFPEESQKYTDLYQIPIKFLGQVTTGKERDLFTGLSQRLIFTNAFCCNKLYQEYFFPIQLAMIKNLEYIKELIARDNPALLIADSNIFNEWYMLLAAYLEIPLVIHYSEGNCRYMQRSFVSAYGITNHTLLTQITVEITGYLYQQCCYYWLMIRTIKLQHRIKSLIKKAFPFINPSRVLPVYITSGIAAVERERIKKGVNKAKDNHIIFPPVFDRRNTKISQALQNWLDKSNGKPVVYISLGTIVRGEKRLFQTIVHGLKELEINILWSVMDDQVSLFQEIGILPNMRVERFAPQPQILALAQVRCFITHGGAGSIQESLLSGKPMLCIPFMFDQPYNGSVIELLNVGIKLWKSKISSRSIHNAVWQLLYNDIYWNAAQNVRQKLTAVDGGQAIIQYLQETGLHLTQHPGSYTP